MKIYSYNKEKKRKKSVVHKVVQYQTAKPSHNSTKYQNSQPPKLPYFKQEKKSHPVTNVLWCRPKNVILQPSQFPPGKKYYFEKKSHRELILCYFLSASKHKNWRGPLLIPPFSNFETILVQGSKIPRRFCPSTYVHAYYNIWKTSSTQQEHTRRKRNASK